MSSFFILVSCIPAQSWTSGDDHSPGAGVHPAVTCGGAPQIRINGYAPCWLRAAAA
jgi:hypothetical protein